jgi:hypothetical protein
MATTLKSKPSNAQGEALLGAGAVLVWNDVTREGRREFYEWHDKEHIPERLQIPGFRRGRRYIKPDHSPEWFTMYEAEDLSVVTSPEYLARLNAPTPATQRTLQYFRNTSRAVCRVACSMGSSSGGHMLTMRLEAPNGTGAALHRLAAEILFPSALDLTGVVACHLYAADESASFTDTAESRTRVFDVPSWVVLAEITTLLAAEELRHLIDGTELAALGVRVRDDAAIYALEICRLAPDDDSGWRSIVEHQSR